MVLGILSSLGSAAAVGLLNGLCSALLRVPSLIVTLGTLSIVSGITLMMTSGMPVYGLPRGFIADFGRALWWGVPAPAYVAIAVVAVGAGSAFAGPAGVWGVAGVGLFAVVICRAIAQVWLRRA